jgi:probable phosphoglycerate mutase
MAQTRSVSGWNVAQGSRIIFWRHGRTAWNLAGRFQGATDVPLDEVGLAQAAAAAPALAAMRPTAIVASDLSRASATAQVLGDLVGLPVTHDAGLRETHGGAWQGLTREEILAQYPELFLSWIAGHDVAPPHGESRHEVVGRVVATVDRHVAALPVGGTLVVVSHGGAIRGGIGGLLGLTPDQWGALGVISNCAWSVLSQVTLPPGPGSREAAQVTRWRLEEYNAAAAPEAAIGADDA